MDDSKLPPIEITCDACKGATALSAFTDAERAEPVAACCHKTLLSLSSRLYVAAALSSFIQLRKSKAKAADKLANECVVSGNRLLRQAAMRWRQTRFKA